LKKCNPILVLIALTAAAVATPASAQFFVGMGLGQSRVDHSTASGVANGVPFTLSGLDSNETTFQFNGGYQFTETWGIQIQYTDLGTRNGTISALGSTGGTGDVKAYQWGIAGTGTWFLGTNVFLRGKLGFSRNHLDDINGSTAAGRAFHVSGSDKTDVLAGIGVGYRWNRNFSTRLEYEYFGKFETAGGLESGNGTNLGLRMQYTF
jgi:outer membrane protein with beta-barrel domain